MRDKEKMLRLHRGRKTSEFGLRRMSRSLLGKDGEKDIVTNVLSKDPEVGRYAA